MTDLDVLNELLVNSPRVRRAMKVYLTKAFRKGLVAGEEKAQQKFDHLLDRMTRLKELNGSTDIFKSEWDESKHNRNHGQFSSAPGGAATAEQPKKSKPEHPSAAKVKTLIGRIREVPKAIRTKVQAIVTKKYAALVDKFGRNGARAIMAATVLMLPVPLPGASMIPIALAHAALKVHGMFKSESTEAVKAVRPEPTREELDAAVREFVTELYREMGEEPPEMPEELDLPDEAELNVKAFDPNEPRDENGEWTSEGGKSTGDSAKLSNNVPVPDSPKMDNEGQGIKIVSRKQHAEAIRKAIEKTKSASKPSRKDIAKARAGLKELGANLYRKKFIGNSEDRKRRREKLMQEFGDGQSCPCVYCGVKIGHGTLEQDKIYTTAEGGRYKIDNLLPCCGGCNKDRGDTPFDKYIAKVNSHAAA